MYLNSIKRVFAFLLVCILYTGVFSKAFSAGEGCVVYIAGASTAADYEPTRHPLTGWGQQLKLFFPAEEVRIENRALSGRSTKSYVSEGHLATIISDIKEGDYLLISFAHNDQKSDSARFTDPKTTYPEYLKMYIDGARQKGATPILVTAIERATQFLNGKKYATHAEYAEAMRKLAYEENVPLIDLQAETMRYFNFLGEQETKKLFMVLEKGEYPKCPNGLKDLTHLNEYGATQIAQIFMNNLASLDISLAQYGAGIESPIPADAAEKTPDVPDGTGGGAK